MSFFSYDVPRLFQFVVSLVCVLASIADRPCTAQEIRLPFSDPGNQGNWELNLDVSDEFNGIELDAEKWLVQGTGGEYKSRWIGRAPTQFSADNVRIDDGKLTPTGPTQTGIRVDTQCSKSACSHSAFSNISIRRPSPWSIRETDW